MARLTSLAENVVTGAVHVQAIGSLSLWLTMSLLVLTGISTDGNRDHHGVGYGGSRIVLAFASPTQSRKLLAMGGGGGGGGGGERGHRFSKLRLSESTSTSSRTGSVHAVSSGRLLQSTIESQWLDPHNGARSHVGVAGLTWSNTVASSAESWARTLAETCEMYHASDSGYGENLYMAWSSGPIDITPTEVVQSWGGERVDYDYETNTCRADRQCGHYTQMVWRNTKEVGCAITSCTLVRDGETYNAQIAVCRYNPPGNYVGERPY
ncbi:hypothetical protein CBR_g31742 [Chara braunii]|uniref:SCP domain-containing protein n=1 Tax=Chara braunii TaxID=69332 RepID=A0A388JY83_CHABU|nr:hypothetical protein CBR_g31742 [Chara braunii]|eukprot:GBG62725.1 hypothetical protein CBR_g31742 [Chara braunii]